MMLTAMDAVLVVGGVALGVLVGHFTSPSNGKAKRLRAELDQVLQDHEAYKASVGSHFRKTADLVTQMTRSYAAVYDHLAVGARQFCDGAGPETRIPFEPLPGALASPDIETVAAEEPAAGAQAAEDAAVGGDGEDASLESAAAPVPQDDEGATRGH